MFASSLQFEFTVYTETNHHPIANVYTTYIHLYYKKRPGKTWSINEGSPDSNGLQRVQVLHARTVGCTQGYLGGEGMSGVFGSKLFSCDVTSVS